MSFSDDAIKQIFNQVDTNHDGFITKEELSKALTLKGIAHKPEQIIAFFQAADANKDNLISLDEFTHFVHFKNSDIRDLDDLLWFTASSVAKLKKIDGAHFLNAGDEHNFDLKLHEGHLTNPNALKTRAKLLISTGAENKNQELLSLINFKLDHRFFISFKFHVTNKALLLSKLPIIYADAKIFLAELGPESAEFLQKTDVEFFEAPDGVIMAFRPRPECFISHYIKMIEASSSKLAQINTSIGLIAGSDMDVAQYKTITYNELLLHNLFIDFFGKITNLANIINLPEVKENLEKMELPKDFDIMNKFFTWVSMKDAKMDLELDKGLKQKLIQASGLAKLQDKVGVQFVNDLKKEWNDNPTRELIESMEFLKQLINVLHEAQNESVTVIAQVKGLIAALNVKASAYDFIQEFIPLK